MSTSEANMPDDTEANSTFTIFNGQNPKKQYEFGFALPAPSAPSSPVQQPMEMDTSGPIRLPEVPSLGPVVSAKKQKLNNGKVKRKIRKLVSNESGSSCEEGFDEGKYRSLFQLRTMVLIAVTVVAAVLMGVMAKENLRNDFYKRYKRQYQLLLYGVEDYCNQEMDLTNMTAALEARVVGQQNAVTKVVNFFYDQQYQPYSSLSFVGPTGTGKSLIANLVAENFQWRSNVHRFFWDASVTREKQYNNFQSYLYSIRHGTTVELSCGHNLLVIDHLGSDDVQMINKIDDRLKFVAAKDGVQITALFVFQGAAVKDDHVLDQMNENVERVFLRQLNEDDLVRCVQIEAKELGIDLERDPRLLKDLMSSVDVRKYGCKAVRAKINFYSQF